MQYRAESFIDISNVSAKNASICKTVSKNLILKMLKISLFKVTSFSTKNP